MSKVVVLTGASSGIGLVTAQYLMDKGYLVVGLSRTKPKGEKMIHYPCDVANKDQVFYTIDQILGKYKKIDVLINNAGMGISGAIEFAKEEDIQRIIDVNIKGVIYSTQAALPALRESKGTIINIGSVAGELTIPFQGFYSMTKAAVGTLTEALAMELRPLKVKVCCVLPGDTKSSFTKNREKDGTGEEIYRDRIVRSIEKMEKDEQKGKDPITVAKVIHRMMNRKHPPVRRVVGGSYQFFVFLKRLLPKRLTQWILYKMYGE